MSAYLTQWLCVNRHCAIALAWEPPQDEETVLAHGRELFASGLIKDHCGICGGALTPETGKLRFATVAEAQPYLEQEQIRQIETRALLDALGNSHDDPERRAGSL